jgi:hypothetical protein
MQPAFFHFSLVDCQPTSAPNRTSSTYSLKEVCIPSCCFATCKGSLPLVNFADEFSAQIDAQPKQHYLLLLSPKDVRIRLVLFYDCPSRLFLRMMKRLRMGFLIRNSNKSLTTKHCQKQPALSCLSMTRCQPSLVSLFVAHGAPDNQKQSCRPPFEQLRCSLMRHFRVLHSFVAFCKFGGPTKPQI